MHSAEELLAALAGAEGEVTRGAAAGGAEGGSGCVVAAVAAGGAADGAEGGAAAGVAGGAEGGVARGAELWFLKDAAIQRGNGLFIFRRDGAAAAAERVGATRRDEL